jgi:hypothetical protein
VLSSIFSLLGEKKRIVSNALGCQFFLGSLPMSFEVLLSDERQTPLQIAPCIKAVSQCFYKNQKIANRPPNPKPKRFAKTELLVLIPLAFGRFSFLGGGS